MDVALLFLPLVGGFIYSKACFLTRYACAREDGHRLYFRAVFVGVLLFGIAFAFRHIALAISTYYEFFEWYIGELAQEFVKKEERSDLVPLAIVCIYAMLLGGPVAIARNWMGRGDAWKQALEKAVGDDPMEALMRKSMLQQKPISLSLENRKVYIGYVVETPEPYSELKAIKLLPLASGYRDEKTLELKITTDYAWLYGSATLKGPSNQKIDSRNFVITLPTGRIVSLNLFENAAYRKFQSQGQGNTVKP